MRGSVKVLGALHGHESELERDFLLQMTIDRTLVAIREQPVTVRFKDPRGESHYTPDYLTMHRGPRPGGLLVQLKYRADLKTDWNRFKPGIRAGMRFARENGLRHVLLTDTEIRREPGLHNAVFLVPYRAMDTDAVIEEHLVHRLAAIGPATPRKLLGAAYASDINRRAAKDHVFKLVAEGRISTNLDEHRVAMDMPIHIDLGGDWRQGREPYSWRPIGLRAARALAAMRDGRLQNHGDDR